MSEIKGIQVFSEIGKLRRVLLHRPNKEIENLTPDLMDRLLFDDIPFLEVAQEEHDAFAKVFRDNGVEVVYLEDLIAETLEDSEIKEQFVNQFLDESNLENTHVRQALYDYYMNLGSNRAMIDQMIIGVRREEIEVKQSGDLASLIAREYPFLSDPLPNLYFTRDPFASIGNGVSINHMRTVTRNRETIFAEYIFKYHPEYKDINVPRWYDRGNKYSIEGGDQLVLSEKVLAIGVSERTDAAAIDEIAKNIFASNQSFETILALHIPNKRAFMHLDTVFTMVDYDKFTIHPEIEGPLSVYSISRGEGEKIEIKEESMELKEILEKYLGLEKVTLIRCGGGNVVDAGREQWNDGSNTLAIAPGEVIVYSRNHVTNKLLEEAGIKLHIIPSSELSRGRGGPRCMSMPLYRDKL